jgi:hypothetical protein
MQEILCVDCGCEFVTLIIETKNPPQALKGNLNHLAPHRAHL